MSTHQEWDFSEIDALLQQGRYEEAIPLLQNILYEEPDHAGALHRLGVAFTESGRQEEAIKTLSFALKKEEKDPDIWEAYGCACYRTGKLEEAKEAFEKAVELFPYHASALRNLGVTLHVMKDFKASYRCLEKSREINPEDYLTLFALSNVCIHLKDFDQAREVLYQLLQLDIPEEIRKQAEITLLNVELYSKHP